MIIPKDQGTVATGDELLLYSNARSLQDDNTTDDTSTDIKDETTTWEKEMKSKLTNYLQQWFYKSQPEIVYDNKKKVPIEAKGLWAGVNHTVFVAFRSLNNQWSEVFTFDFNTERPAKDKYMGVKIKGNSAPTKATCSDMAKATSAAMEWRQD